jgi:hypothetical protein
MDLPLQSQNQKFQGKKGIGVAEETYQSTRLKMYDPGKKVNNLKNH